MKSLFMSPRWLGPAVVLLMLFGLIAQLGIRSGDFAAAEEHSRLRLDPDHAAMGATVEVTGEHFPDEARGVLVWDAGGTELAKFETDDDGEFSVEFSVPAVSGSGDYSISAFMDENKNDSGPAATVTLSVDPTPQATDTETPTAEVDDAVSPTARPTKVPATSTPVPDKPTSTASAKPTRTATARPTRTATPEGPVAFSAAESMTLPLRAIFYYPWFPNAWTQHGIYPYTNFTPSAGYYDGGDPAIISDQIAAMQYGGIQVGISSWWGQGHHTDSRLSSLLAAAAGTGFKWTVYYEAESMGDPSASQITDDLSYLREQYASDSSFLKIDGKFVVFVYADASDGCGMADRWDRANTVGAYVVLKVFSGYRTCASQPESWHQYAPSSAADSQGGYSYSISPGFWKVGESPRLERNLDRWAQNVRDMVASGAPWQLIVSFNEWGEGTSIESANEWATASGRGAYLDVLRNNGQAVPDGRTPTAAPPSTATPKATRTPTRTGTPAQTSTPTGSATKYRLVASGASPYSATSTYVRDGKMSTVWKTRQFQAPPRGAWVWVDLGARKPIGTIRWVFGQYGIGDYFEIEGSNNLNTWSYITKRNGKPVGLWQEKIIDRTFRYIRFRFENPRRDLALGGLAEVQVWSPGTAPALPEIKPTPQPTATRTATPAPTSTATPVVAKPRPSPPAGATVIIPGGDAHVAEAAPRENVGSASALQVDAGDGERKVSYLKFTIGGQSGKITSAKLQLYIRSGTNDGPTVQLAANAWTESTVTWANRPPLMGRGIDDKDALLAGGWVEFDVAPLISGKGVYTFALVATSRDGVSFASRDDAARRPLLILTVDGTGEVDPSPTPPPTDGGSVLLAAGDIADCGSTGDEATAKLLDGLNGTVATLGDNVYNAGTNAEFANCFDPSWGRHKDRIRPSAGNHEYGTTGAAGYFNYFGAAAGNPGEGYYSYDLGTWHIVVLNSNCSKIGGCDASSAQFAWLEADLAANPADCTLAYWHHPLFSSGDHGNNSVTKPLWQLLQDTGAEIVLTGHDHDYERFVPQTANGAADPKYGIREFVVGTGGKSHYAFGTIQANSVIRYNDGHGVLRLVLGNGTYSWKFISEAGKSFTDTGTGTCHDAPVALTDDPQTFAVVSSSTAGPADVADIRRYHLGVVGRSAAA